jgi:hypothetical protein
MSSKTTDTEKPQKLLLRKKQLRRSQALTLASGLLSGSEALFTPKRYDRPLADLLDLSEYLLHGDVTIRHTTEDGLALLNLNRTVEREVAWTDVARTPGYEEDAA